MYGKVLGPTTVLTHELDAAPEGHSSFQSQGQSCGHCSGRLPSFQLNGKFFLEGRSEQHASMVATSTSGIKLHLTSDEIPPPSIPRAGNAVFYRAPQRASSKIEP